MKTNDRMAVARLADQANNPGNAAPGAARPVEVEVLSVPSVSSTASPVGLLAADVWEGKRSSVVRDPAVVNTKASVLTALKASQIVVNRAMTGTALGTQLARHKCKRG
jgi:hypothetical protein